MSDLTHDERLQILDAIWTKRDDGPSGYPVVRWGIDFPVIESIMATRESELVAEVRRLRKGIAEARDTKHEEARQFILRALLAANGDSHTDGDTGGDQGRGGR